ncbi:hypothetical protein ACRALDRAFT_2064401, partial [Sodiomyces alcalophilus JCM 7366]|uniref:uncharacterized protein n=1 Tax=Sodiomyces alcalophilus JCM 7366 TaxID=591952 RepID=UPI0039B36EBF
FRPSSSKTRWKMRQGSDRLVREARTHGLKSRAAFKLLELDGQYRIFRKGQVVVDLGYAPGSWSQIAHDRTGPSGNVIGIDLIPAQPPRGVTAIQGNFLLPEVQSVVKDFLVTLRQRSRATAHNGQTLFPAMKHEAPCETPQSIDGSRARLVDTEPTGISPNVVLSDMSAPSVLVHAMLWSLLLTYLDRMMNTSGIAFHDHARSMDLCYAALQFASDTLKHGGHFICKFYQGPEDREFETLLKQLFTEVRREKPESSRKVSA